MDPSHGVPQGTAETFHQAPLHPFPPLKGPVDWTDDLKWVRKPRGGRGLGKEVLSMFRIWEHSLTRVLNFSRLLAMLALARVPEMTLNTNTASLSLSRSVDA
ncbi:hypothetical protein PUNSTDRAFT_55537 [Punctularia strigosozonata HHB-11173 SS5]|uniref:Uncharacterized protein n=1 Tax=Punctularia strigosozonata (strain HHB-11173) TaxID=741275 RepID=R7S2T1_PUNST|nr:uncharacterized protein PUNSTDRAFT_55537 [Punctularia strigosozonata HHB-11173 SS5]EIN04523.1 hypothetical protein PUNSTDRAFT_55537 [Punctularia strigosozonata HHB-11173 SS5]